MLPNGIDQAFRNHNESDELREIVDEYEQLASRTEVSHKVFRSEHYGEPSWIRANGLVYRQVLLYRSIQLFEGSLRAAVDENFYSMVLNIRGHFETTASIGYFHRRVQSLERGDISLDTLAHDLYVQMLGGRHESIPHAPDPKNIRSQFEHADKSVSISVLGGTAMQYGILKESYEFLSEFCHPNFHSNSVGIDIDDSVSESRFRYGQPMRDEEFTLIKYLLFSAPFFVALYDQIPGLLPSKE